MSNKQKRWLKASLIRAVKTAAQSAVAMVGTASIMADVKWEYVLSASALSFILSILTSTAGLPEVKCDSDEL